MDNQQQHDHLIAIQIRVRRKRADQDRRLGKEKSLNRTRLAGFV